MTEKVQLIHLPTSQPSRTVEQFLLETGIPYEEYLVDLLTGENETAEFKAKYNPTGQVPILVDGDFVLWESVAICSYLNEKFRLPGHWFGDSLEQRALIQQYCHFHATKLRPGSGAFFYTLFAECIWGPRDYSREIDLGNYMLYEAMDIMEGWLSKTPYLCGDEISFADLLSIHEFTAHYAGQIISQEQWGKYPAVKAWFDRVYAREHTKATCKLVLEVSKKRLAGEMIPMTRKTSLAKGTSVEPGVPEKVA